MASSRDCQTQDALARKSGVGQTTIGRILRGEVDPQIGTMTFLAVALGMTLKTLAAVAEGEKAVKHVEVDCVTSTVLVESARRLAYEFREDVRWNIAKARKALERGDLEDARWHLGRAKVWRVNAHHWARTACGL
jgi:transcriptional regulator with XRE-family HTH domain